MKTLLTTFALTCAVATGAQAQLITNAFTGTFTFTGSSGTNIPFLYNGTTIPNLAVGAWDKIGITNSSSASNFRGSSWALDNQPAGDLTGAVNLGKYLEFGLTAAAGSTMNMTNITFESAAVQPVRDNGSGVQAWTTLLPRSRLTLR